MKQTVKTSRAAGQLEKMFRELNKHYFAGKLPEPIISLKKTPSAYGHITCSKVWQAGGENKYEINISSATLDRPHRGDRFHPAARDGARVLHGDRHQGHQQQRGLSQPAL